MMMPTTPQPTTRRAYLVAPRQVELRSVEVPRPDAGELLVEVRCALSCGTDLKTWRRGHPMFRFPMAFGHEFSGVIAAVGEGVTQFSVGDEIMAAPTAPCGRCFFCSRGQENLCPDAVGRMLMGAYADYILLPRHIVELNTLKKPADLSFEEAALLEPIACVVHAQEIAGPERRESVAIIGSGAFGLMHLALLKAAGIREVTVIGRGHMRLQWAGQMGADRVVDASQSDAAAEVAALNGGFGPDLVIEATGQVTGWQDALMRVRRGGRIVFFGGCPAGTKLEIDTRRMHYDNLTLLAPFHYRPRDVRKAYELLSGRRLVLSSIINARRRLADIVEVFTVLDSGAALKCAVTP
jgi:L-iditol 2-dehydrogenase